MPVSWLGKKSLFRPPFGWWMRGVGGIPVDRSRRTRLVDAIIDVIRPMDELFVVIPPEGTRSRSGHWKSGFYWVAAGAGILGFLDYENKRGGLGEIFHPTGDLHADFPKISAFYEGMKGKFPELQGPITLELDEGA